MALKSHFMKLPDSKAETLRQAFGSALRELRLNRELDAFEAFADLDERADDE